MSEMNPMSESWTNIRETWPKVEEAVARASDLYVRELTDTLDWAQGMQREMLEQSLLTARAMARFGEQQLAFWARLRESVPLPGGLPKGTETVQGMVRAVVRETGHKE